MKLSVSAVRLSYLDSVVDLGSLTLPDAVGIIGSLVRIGSVVYVGWSYVCPNVGGIFRVGDPALILCVAVTSFGSLRYDAAFRNSGSLITQGSVFYTGSLVLPGSILTSGSLKSKGSVDWLGSRLPYARKGSG